MRIATWNVNSLRSRIDRVEAFVQRHDIDVLALQETKAREDQLPVMGLQSLGYEVAAAGTNQWNGVAILSRVGIEDVQVGFEGMPGFGEPLAAESRAIGALCGGVRIWSLVVGGVFLVLALALPRALSWLNRSWMKFGLLLGKIVSPIATMSSGRVMRTPIGEARALAIRLALRLSASPVTMEGSVHHGACAANRGA